MLQTAVNFVDSATTFGACSVENCGPPVFSLSPLPFIDDVLFLSIPPALSDGGEGDFGAGG